MIKAEDKLFSSVRLICASCAVVQGGEAPTAVTCNDIAHLRDGARHAEPPRPAYFESFGTAPEELANNSIAPI